jgi:uncharacterized repeat protein (TIGR03803 family)
MTAKNPSGREMKMKIFTKASRARRCVSALFQGETRRAPALLLLMGALITSQFAQAQTKAAAYEVLYVFQGGADGGVPVASLLRDGTGNLYGTAEYRGTYDWGVIFKLDTSGKETVLHTFTGGADGATPRAELIRDATGNLYGTALQGGRFGCGVVFRIDSNGKYSVPYSFNCAEGTYPEGGLLLDSAGDLYGTASFGGDGYGVIFKLDPRSRRQTVLHRFTGGADGAQPMAGLISDNAGNLYGTTEVGGNSNVGVVFKLETSGTLTVLYSFTGGADGGYPVAGLIQDSAGNLYGTATTGGVSCIFSGNGCGVVFKLDPTTGMETVLHAFSGGTDGSFPDGKLFLDSAGNLYGTAAGGGASGGCGGGGCGVVFKLNLKTSKESVLYTFTGGADGGQPTAGLIRDSAGSFYGTAGTGGFTSDCGLGCGVVFKLTELRR